MLTVIIFFTCFMNLMAEKQLLMSLTGEVARGNYSYYSLTYEGSISLYLYSLVGDADLYVSQVYTTPTFEPETYCLQSSTCGLDVIHIPKSFHRPLGIGVYGHPSHETSTYLLEVVFQYNEDIFYEDEGEEMMEIPFDTYGVTSHEKIRTFDTQEEEDSFIWALIWSFFDILLEVLFL